jgi:hypothetical protein
MAAPVPKIMDMNGKLSSRKETENSKSYSNTSLQSQKMYMGWKNKEYYMCCLTGIQEELQTFYTAPIQAI